MRLRLKIETVMTAGNRIVMRRKKFLLCDLAHRRPVLTQVLSSLSPPVIAWLRVIFHFYFAILFTYSIFYFFYIDIDLSNLPAPEAQVPANGSSRSTGGILRGNALGNAPNIGDLFDAMPQDVQPLSRGRVNVTIVQQPPSNIVVENPTSHLKVNSPCYETLGPLLKKVARSYSPVRSKCLVI